MIAKGALAAEACDPVATLQRGFSAAVRVRPRGAATALAPSVQMVQRNCAARGRHTLLARWFTPPLVSYSHTPPLAGAMSDDFKPEYVEIKLLGHAAQKGAALGTKNEAREQQHCMRAVDNCSMPAC